MDKEGKARRIEELRRRVCNWTIVYSVQVDVDKFHEWCDDVTHLPHTTINCEWLPQQKAWVTEYLDYIDDCLAGSTFVELREKIEGNFGADLCVTSFRFIDLYPTTG